MTHDEDITYEEWRGKLNSDFLQTLFGKSTEEREQVIRGYWANPRLRRLVSSAMTPNEELEQALIDVATMARDGEGQQVMLLPLELTSKALRTATRNFMAGMIDERTVFLGLDGGTLQSKPASEIAAWRNLALLANATAAAVKAGR